ncbi:thermonuclease family protein [Methylobacterium sp. Leaf85]|uniref:thermonuclease family protein n=1 Tax=Methylobacterium sp. Leaf85 TaxID=1736241 RepID=UPI003FCD0CDF
MIHDTKIRLHGIDAPESAQLCQDGAGKDYRCGQAAALALADQIGAATVSCDPRDTDKYSRTVAVCRKGAEDLNEWMVAQGYAIAYRRYSLDYVPAETTAKAIKRGIWAGTFQEPSEWRKAKREGGSEGRQEPARADGCTIKGNISRKGEKVFHVPGSRDYDRTRISEKAGERMFCSEDEARAAGWRAPKG